MEVYNTPVTLSIVSVDVERNGAILLTRITALLLDCFLSTWMFWKENELPCVMRILFLDIG